MNWVIEMKKKLIGVFAVVAFVGFVYSGMCIACIAKQGYVSTRDYARMSQEIVAQSLIGAAVHGSREDIQAETVKTEHETMLQSQKSKQVRIKFTFDGKEAIAELEDNATSRDFLQSMPMMLHFKDFNETEKIADPPKSLSKENVPDGFVPKTGDLAVYGPWGNISVFYKDFRYSKGLIPMGYFISGLENLAGMNGEFDAKVEIISKE